MVSIILFLFTRIYISILICLLMSLLKYNYDVMWVPYLLLSLVTYYITR